MKIDNNHIYFLNNQDKSQLFRKFVLETINTKSHQNTE